MWHLSRLNQTMNYIVMEISKKKSTYLYEMVIMKHILKILTNKIIISGLIIIAQFLLVLYYVRELMFAYSFIYIFMMILSLLLVIWVVNRDENPSYGMAWSIVILIFPPLGAVVYLLMGGRKAPIELRERITEDRKSTRLNSSHVRISYAVFCLKKKNNNSSK